MDRDERMATAGLVAAVLLGFVLRVVVAGDVAFSPADEGRYLAMATAVAEGGTAAFHGLVEQTLASPALWLFPTPLRYGHVLLAALACKLHGGPSFEALAALSTAAGMLTVVLTGWLGLRVAGARIGAVAAFVMACSPLALALGRRALQDAVVVAAATLVLVLVVELRREARLGGGRAWGLALGVSLASALLVALKETSLFLLLALTIDAAVEAARDRSVAWRLAPLLAGPLLAFAGFLVWVGNASEWRSLVDLATRSADGAYVRAYMAGPPHRVLVDLLVLAPVASLLAIVGAAAPRGAGPKEPAFRLVKSFLLAGLVAAACLPKNVRFTAALEPALAVVAAQGLASLAASAESAWRRTVVTVLPLAGIGLGSWLLFARVFLERGVYDPTTIDLLTALDAVPHGGVMDRGTVAAPAAAIFVVAVSLAVSLGIRASRAHDPG